MTLAAINNDPSKRTSRGWIGVDLDGTLAVYDRWRGEMHIGDPIPQMVDRVRAWVDAGTEVRIFTARAFNAPPEKIQNIEAWCEQHIGTRLPVTCTKDYRMILLVDDRALQVIPNTGSPAIEEAMEILDSRIMRAQSADKDEVALWMVEARDAIRRATKV